MMRFFLVFLCITSLSTQASTHDAPEFSEENSSTEESQDLPTTSPTYENNILAVVNNDIITTHDLNTRLRMLTQGNLASIPKDQLPSLRQAILNKLIVELLMLQVVDRAHIPVTTQEIEEQITHIEQAQNIPAGTIHRNMKTLGIPPEVYQRQFKAQIGWEKYVIGAYQHTAHVSEKDIEDSISIQQNKPRYLLSEIRLMFINPDQQEPARKAALHLTAQIEKGASFGEVAQQVSNAPSALNGGEIGWILESQLPNDTADILRPLPINSITPPILNKQRTHYTIYQLRDKVIPGITASPFVVARQMNIKTQEGQDSQTQLENLRKKFESVTTCQQFDDMADQIPDAQLAIFNELPLSQMSKDLQTALKDLPIGKVSSGILNGDDNTIVFFFVCNRYDSAIPPEAKTEASDILTKRRLSLHADKAIRDLQRSSLIDVRI
jgi:peptidyl-prolyl cis-trans isomerase SurA